MMHKTALYLDGGSPNETHEINELLLSKKLEGLDGQTTNPSLIAKNLAAQKNGEKITSEEAFAEYKRIVTEMRKSITGPISIQVIGNPETLTAEEMLSQARDRIDWIENAVIKFPCTEAGLTAIETFCQEGPVNVTLVFSQAQAQAVYAATRYATHEVYVSPFVGRIDDRGQSGMDVIANILEMYKRLGDGHVQVLTASTRTIKHLHYALKLGSQIITIPYSLYKDWEKEGFSQPGEEFIYDVPGLENIPYQEVTLDGTWKEINIAHELTKAGLSKFWEDWSSVVV